MRMKSTRGTNPRSLKNLRPGDWRKRQPAKAKPADLDAEVQVILDRIPSETAQHALRHRVEMIVDLRRIVAEHTRTARTSSEIRSLDMLARRVQLLERDLDRHIEQSWREWSICDALQRSVANAERVRQRMNDPQEKTKLEARIAEYEQKAKRIAGAEAATDKDRDPQLDP